MSKCIICNNLDGIICKDCLEKLKTIVHEEDIKNMLEVRQTYEASTKDVLEPIYGVQNTKLLLASQKEFDKLLELNK